MRALAALNSSAEPTPAIAATRTVNTRTGTVSTVADISSAASRDS
jgi:hypothetical protein